MIRINLLPHREEKRKARQKQFTILAGLAAGLAVAVAGLLWVTFDSLVSNQKGRNTYLNNEISKLDKQIEEIKKLREETASLLAKKQVVEGLQSNRSEPVYLLDQLLRQLPEGLYLKSVKQVNTKVSVSGFAQSHARISAFMRNIQASPYLENPELVEIKEATVGTLKTNEFMLNFFIKRAKAEDSKAGAKKANTMPAKPGDKKS